MQANNPRTSCQELRHRIIGYLILLLPLAVLLSGCDKSDKKKDTDRQAPQIEVAKVITDSVTLSKTYPGTLSAVRSLEVMCRVNGHVTGIFFHGGDYVKEGQVLYTIDPTVYRNDVQSAEATLANAKAQLEYAEVHYEAMTRALESNAVSKMEVAQALSDRDQARSAINSAQAALANARTRLGYCTIKSPGCGHITSNQVSMGQYVNGEGSPVSTATVYDDASLIAHFAIEDKSFERIWQGENGRGNVDYSRLPLKFGTPLPHTYTADLSYMDPHIDPSTGTINLEAMVGNPYGELRSGMYITIDVPYKVDPAAMLVLDSSLGTDQRGRYLYTVTDSNTVAYTPVEVGDLVADTLRVITSGVQPGQRYVSAALLKVRTGMKIEPREITVTAPKAVEQPAGTINYDTKPAPRPTQRPGTKPLK